MTTAGSEHKTVSSARRRGAARSQDQPPPIRQLSLAGRVAAGKAARDAVPRASHAGFEPTSTRADPIALLEHQATRRVPELVPIRYGRMLLSPFAFYRGAAMIMAHDLAGTPRSGLTVQCCGDAHLANFGVFASQERRLVFDVNDFDETLPGPWEWDVKRLATSMLIAARENGFSVKHQDGIVLQTLKEYRTTMRRFAGMHQLDVWYAHLDIEAAVHQLASQLKETKATARQVERAEKNIAKAHARDSMSAFAKLTQVVDGNVAIVDQSPLIVPLAKLATNGQADTIFEELHYLMRVYRESLEADRRVLLDEFELRDFARKVVGVGSVGTRAWIVLMTACDDRDPLFLQVKEAEASVLEPLLGRSEFPNHGQRVVTGQRLMQATSDIFLGWLRVTSGIDGKGHDYYVRQLKDWKGSAEIDQMIPKGMASYGKLCGWTLARAHARSGDRIAIAAYLGTGDTFDKAILEFSKVYAEQNERDFNKLVDAVKSGRIVAQTGL